MDKVIVCIGGAPEFNNAEVAFKEIEVNLKKAGITPDRIYGFGTTKNAGEGGNFYAQKWAEDNGIEFRSGNPKFYREDRSYNPNAVMERNQILSKISAAMIVFIEGNSTGGNGIISEFETQGVPIFKVGNITETIAPTIADSMPVYSKVAKELLKNSVTLDVETTGLSNADDIIELAILDVAKDVVIFHSHIFTETPVNPNAFAVNGITPEMLAGKPTLKEAWKTIEKKLKGKIIVASNSKFDERMVCYGLVKQKADTPNNLWTCLQELYCKYSGQPRKGMNTERIAKQLGIEPGTHSALTDAQAQGQILKAMAEGVVPNLSL